jgi:hypothetical protein
MNFIVMRRDDMALGVDCFAMAGNPAAGGGGMLGKLRKVDKRVLEDA